MAFSAGFLACGGAVEAPSPEGATPSGGSPGPGEGNNPPGTAPSPTPLTPPPSTSSPTPANPPPHPTPNPYAWSNGNHGCADVVLYDVTLSQQRVIAVTLDRKSLGLLKAGDTVNVDLATQRLSAIVRVDDYAQPLQEIPVCNDIGISQRPFASAEAISGTLTITLESAPAQPGQTFVVTARTSNVHILNAKGADEVLQDDRFDHVTVGWLAG